MTFYLACQLLVDSGNNFSGKDLGITILLGLPLVIFPLWSYLFLRKHKDDLQNIEFKKKYGGLYDDLK